MQTTQVATTPPQAGRKEWLALAVLALPLLLVSMDVSVLYFAAPEISRDLHASSTQQLWIFDIYGFVLAGMLITMGAVADRIGPRRLLLVGAACFSATSLLAAYAGSAGQLIAARGILGVAGATLMPATLSMLRSLFRDERQRGKAIGAWTGIMTGGIGLGPVLSGVLLQHFWWGSVFLINLPAMALLLILGPLLLPVGDRRHTPLDVPSSVLSLAGVLVTIFGVKQWAADGFDARWAACIVLGSVLLLAFGRRQFRHKHAMVPPALLRNTGYCAALTGNAICSFALVGNAVLFTAYLQLVLGYDPLAAALWSILPTVGVAAVAPLASPLGRRLGKPVAAALGMSVAACGFVVLMTVGTESLVVALVGAGVLAAGLVVTMTVASELVLSSVEPGQAGIGSSVSEAASELGGALGIAILGSIAAAGYRSEAAGSLPGTVAHGAAGDSLAEAVGVASGLPRSLADQVLAAARDAYVHGIHLAAAAGAVLLVLAAVTLWTNRRKLSA
jgi:DHA2 family multidrug resistance protein-like MFS transporter